MSGVVSVCAGAGPRAVIKDREPLDQALLDQIVARALASSGLGASPVTSVEINPDDLGLGLSAWGMMSMVCSMRGVDYYPRNDVPMGEVRFVRADGSRDNHPLIQVQVVDKEPRC